MSNVPDITTNIRNDLIATGAVSGRAIGIIGHRDLLDATVSSSVKAYSASTRGVIYNRSSLADWIDLLGTVTTPDFVEGRQDDGTSTAAITPHSPKNNIMYSLALIYAAFPTANVYAAIIDGDSDGLTGNDTTAIPAGASTAADDLLMYDDIGYFLFSNIDPVAAGKSHAETAASPSNAYNSPRFYMTGLDLFKVFDGVTYAGSGAPLDATNDLSTWSGVKSDYGLVISYIGNHDFNFSTIGDNNTYQIGGQLVAAWLAGRYASRTVSYSVTYSAMDLGATKFTDNYTDNNPIDYIFSLNELNEAITDGYTITRFSQNSYVLAKGITFASATGTNWLLYPHRSITNYIHRALVSAIRQFMSKQKLPTVLAAAQKLAEATMSNAVARQYISSFDVSVKSHPTEVDAIVMSVSFETVKPINKIYLNLIVS